MRDPRGFAIKFYTDEGNWDLVGNNTPVFFVRDPLKFPNFIHAVKRNPVSNLRVMFLKCKARNFSIYLSNAVNKNFTLILGHKCVL